MFKKIPDYIIPVLDRLESAGFEAYLVGGCVRDCALGKEPNDYDITTNAKPDETMRVFSDYRVIETGLKHGTVTVISDGECVEITTYRIDGEYADNRHPESVSFTDDITLDLSRRDFTVNAMAYSRALGLCDPFGGMGHLDEKKIVCVGSPEARFKEDGLRILRALRFASVLDFSIDPATAIAIRDLSGLLRGISKERIYTELCKLLCGKGAQWITREYCDVLEVCAEGISRHVFDGCAEKLSLFSSGDHVMRLAYLCRCSADERNIPPREAAALIMRSLKTSSADLKRAVLLAEAAGIPYPDNETDIKRLMGRLGEDNVADYALIRRVYADIQAEAVRFLEEYRAVAATNPCVKVSDLAINGSEVMILTGKKGAVIGVYLSRLLDEVISDSIPNTKEALSGCLLKYQAEEDTSV